MPLGHKAGLPLSKKFANATAPLVFLCLVFMGKGVDQAAYMLIEQEGDQAYDDSLEQGKRSYDQKRKGQDAVDTAPDLPSGSQNRFHGAEEVIGIPGKQEIRIGNHADHDHAQCAQSHAEERSLTGMADSVENSGRQDKSTADDEVGKIPYIEGGSPLKQELQQNLERFDGDTRQRPHREGADKYRNLAEVQFIKAGS